MNVAKLKGKFKPESWQLLKQVLRASRKCGISKNLDIPQNLKSLYDTITSAFVNISNNIPMDTHNMNRVNNGKRKILNFVRTNPFIRIGQFENWITNSNFKSITFKSAYHHYKIECQIFFTNETTNAIHDIAKEIIAKYFTLAWIYRDHADCKFLILLSNESKMFYCTKFSPNCVLGVENVNTGSSTVFYDSKKTRIIELWRKEELQKVAIHEIIHALELDFSDTQKFDDFLKRELNLKVSNVNSNEAYVETWANLLNCMFASLKLSNNEKNWNLFAKMVHFEQIFALHQISKLLKYHQIHSIFDLSELWQKSHVFSYYLLKGCYLVGIREFIQFCIQNGNDRLVDVNEKNPEIFNLLVALFRSTWTPQFEKFTKMCNVCDGNDSEKKMCWKNLRMTVVELR